MAFYRIYFKVSGYEDEIMLPVNPQEITVTYPGNLTNYDVEGLGEIIVPRIGKLATVTFESFFPRERIFQTLTNNDYWNTPEWYVTFFKNIQKSRQPFELVISRGYDECYSYDDNGEKVKEDDTAYFDTVFKAVLMDFSITDKGGEPGDVYYNMTISEYRDASPKTLAELASEKKDDEGNVIEQQFVLTINRPPQPGEKVVGRTVQISGEVFERPEESTQETAREVLGTVKQKVNQVDRIISRVLPPEVSGSLHSIYVSGLGWVDKGNCKLGETVTGAQGLSRLVTNNYD